MKKLAAVIFDLDGVIANTVELYFEAGKRLADELNVPYSRELNQKLQGLNRYKTVEIMLGDKVNLYSEAEICSHGDLKSEYYRELLETLSEKDVLPGILDFLNEIKEFRIKTALASSSSNADLVLKKLGVEKYIDYVVDIREVKNGKPSPEIFLLAAEGLGIAPHNCAAIEDGEAGLAGIMATEMFSIGVGKHKEMAKANWYIESTTELQLNTLLEKWGDFHEKRCY
ncbi:MAG: beta-phosphoglucomutase [Anaerobacillus sp.]|uniref:beta-phosphoglucomutase n=1 Tax=Anaerobacillus sp. TaxID=1872506 RepID=UPI00391BA623